MVIRRHIEVSEHDPTVSLLEAPSADYSTCASNSSSEIIMDLCVRYRYQESAGKGSVVEDPLNRSAFSSKRPLVTSLKTCCID
jgi:hypothetical protein